MFSFIRILNAPSNAIEPIKQLTTAGVAYSYGALLTLTNGRLTHCTANDKPLFIAGETAGADEKELITVYPISPDMLFRAPTSSTPALLKIGSKLTLNIVDGVAVGVGGASEGGVATLVDNRGAIRSGDQVTVRFDA